MKTLVFALLLTLAFTVNGLAQKCKEYSEPGSSYAFCPPEGWKLDQKKGEKTYEFNSPSKIANISVMDATDRGPRDMVSFNIIKSAFEGGRFKDPSLVFMGESTTTSGLPGTKLVFNFDQDGVPFVSVYYLIDGPNKTYFDFIVTATRNDTAAVKAADAMALSVHAK